MSKVCSFCGKEVEEGEYLEFRATHPEELKVERIICLSCYEKVDNIFGEKFIAAVVSLAMRSDLDRDS